MRKSKLFEDLDKFIENNFALEIIDLFYLIGFKNNHKFNFKNKILKYEDGFLINENIITENTVFLINTLDINENKCKEIIKNLNKINFDFFILIENDNFSISKFIKKNFKSSLHTWEKINKSFKLFTDNKDNRNIFFFKKEDTIYSSDLFIQGTSNDDILPKNKVVNYIDENFTLQDDFINLIKKINFNIKKNNHFSVLRFNDGDFYFLRRLPVGSAKPGSRSITKNYDEIDINFYRKNFLKNCISLERHIYAYNYFCLELILSFLDPFYDFIKIKFDSKLYIFPNMLLQKFFHSNFFHKFQKIKIINSFMNYLIKIKLSNYKNNKHFHEYINKSFIAGESIRSIISTRWIFKKYHSSICLIGNQDKIDLIKKLVEYKEYRNYLGIKNFKDYISIQAKGAANDFQLAKEIKRKIMKSEAQIFLIGIGSLKITLLPLLKDIDKIFIDVGAGIDAIAGVISNDRPFFKRWINYQLSDFKLNSIDLMDQNNPNRFSDKYKKIILKR